MPKKLDLREILIFQFGADRKPVVEELRPLEPRAHHPVLTP